MKIKLKFPYCPERNATDDIETDLTPAEFADRINSKLLKVQGKYLGNSKQGAKVEEGIVIVVVE